MKTPDEILSFWFGHVEETIVPSKHRARLWFSSGSEVEQEINEALAPDLILAEQGKYSGWHATPRGQLALIILYDQIARHVYHGSVKAFAFDNQAQAICLNGMEQEAEHRLSLIERVFYYFPLLHSENLQLQQQSVYAYESLLELALPETRGLYDSFLQFALHHFGVVRQFGRFPQRNQCLGRESTKEELAYLQQHTE